MSIMSILRDFIEDLTGEKESKGKKKSSRWEYIGSISVVTGHKVIEGNIPRWVLAAPFWLIFKQRKPREKTKSLWESK